MDRSFVLTVLIPTPEALQEFYTHCDNFWVMLFKVCETLKRILYIQCAFVLKFDYYIALLTGYILIKKD